MMTEDFNAQEGLEDHPDMNLQEPVDRQDKPEITELSQKGYHCLKGNRFQEALDYFQQILRIEPDNNYALVGMGDAARKQGRYQEAIQYYETCLKSHPQNSYALFGLADSFKALRNYSKAIEIWEQYLAYDSKNITVLTRIADAYRKVKNLPKSRELYDKVLELEKDNPYALIGLGHLYFDFKEYEKALYYWERMIQTHPDSIDIRLLTSIGNCYRKLKAYRRGIEYFARALSMDENNFYALFGMADCYRGMNLHRESLNYWNRILANDPDNKVILTRAGDSYRAMGELDKAEELYRKALNIEFDAYAILGLALIAKAKGRHEEAIESLEHFLKNDPKNTRLYVEIADCYIHLGNTKKAAEVLSHAVKEGVHSSHIAELYEKIKKDLQEEE